MSDNIETLFFQALEKLHSADKTAANAVTPAMRLAIRNVLEGGKDDNGLPLFNKDTFKASLIRVYGTKPKADGTPGKTLADTPRKHSQQFDYVFDNMGKPAIAPIVRDFAYHANPLAQRASFSALIAAIKAELAKAAKEAADKAGVAEAEGEQAPAEGEQAPVDVATTIAGMKAFVEAMTAEQVADCAEQLAGLYEAIASAWENCPAVELKEAA